jgi:cytochrome c oxidase assembly protein subunit 15
MTRMRRSYHVGVNVIPRTSGATALLRGLALASLIANVGIVVTGGAVRLTGSGLGCPTWPKCDGSSYVTTAAMGYHGEIEFTNRTLTGLVGVLALACLVAAFMQPRELARRRSQITWATIVLASIPAQAVLGGFTVLTKLNPWLVSSHFLLSSAVIAAAYQLWVRTRGDVARSEVRPPIRALGWAIVGVTALVLAAGTVVTGSGPHAGDAHAKRTGLDPAMIAQLHTDLVMLLIGLSVAAWIALAAAGATAGARAAGILVIVECSQALIGFVQYFTHLPVVLVGVHMFGACLVLIAALRLLTALKVGASAAATEIVELPGARTPQRV